MVSQSKQFHTKSLVSLILLYIFLIPFLTTFGSVDISFGNVITVITHKLGLTFQSFDYSIIGTVKEQIIIDIRLPRVILAGIVGMILALVGASFQAVFKNPLADPFVMGTSSGAALGITLGILFGMSSELLGISITTIFAFICAILTTLLVYQLAKVGEKVSTTSILLAGIVTSSIITSLISLIMIFKQDQISNIILMTMGSFNSATWNQVIIIGPLFIIASSILLFKAQEMNALVMGDMDAHSIGVNANKNKIIILISSALLVALAVSASGIIGFVGIIIPHLLRLLFGPNHRTLLPLSAISGAIFLLVCDSFSRTFLENTEIPIGIITALCGGPFFLMLLKRHKNRLI
ncbi:MAG: iron ABC transporter permease [Fibrobacterales bacterium]